MMANELPFASASTAAEASGLVQQPSLNIIRGRGGCGGAVDVARDGQPSDVVQVCHSSIFQVQTAE